MRGMQLVRSGIAAAALAVAGCADADFEAYRASESVGAAATPASVVPASEASDAAPGAGDRPAGVPRRIIYKAEIELTVGEFDEAALALRRLVAEHGGYLATTDLYGRPGSSRRGTWTARVPVDRYEAFVEAALALGELERNRADSQDVTADYHDLEAQIRNNQVEEERLIAHLKETAGDLKEILEVERALSRVRGEVERMQGRLRLLSNLTELTTVTVTLRERTRYTPARAATFGERLGRRFRASAEQFGRFAQEAALAIASVVPWLPFWAALAGIAWGLRRLGLLPRFPRPAGRRPGPRSGTIATPPPPGGG